MGEMVLMAWEQESCPPPTAVRCPENTIKLALVAEIAGEPALRMCVSIRQLALPPVCLSCSGMREGEVICPTLTPCHIWQVEELTPGVMRVGKLAFSVTVQWGLYLSWAAKWSCLLSQELWVSSSEGRRLGELPLAG